MASADDPASRSKAQTRGLKKQSHNNTRHPEPRATNNQQQRNTRRIRLEELVNIADNLHWLTGLASPANGSSWAASVTQLSDSILLKATTKKNRKKSALIGNTIGRGKFRDPNRK